MTYNPTTNNWDTFNTGFSTTSIPPLVLVAIGPSAPHKMYAKLDQTVYKYDTTTATWQSLGNHGGGTQGFWSNVLAVDPTNSDIIFVGGTYIERSFDGGLTWQSVFILHADQHALVFDSTNHLNAYAGNDGGVYRGVYTQPTDTGVWSKVSNGLIITQFNQVGVSDTSMDIFGGGAQDNGTNRTVGGFTWDHILCEDGGYFIVDPSNVYILYAEVQHGVIYKSTDGGASWNLANNGFPGGPFVTPTLLDPTSPPDPNRVLFAGGYSQVYRTTNSATTWTISSPDLGGFVNAITLTPASAAIVYAGIEVGKIWRRSDNGVTTANWKDITVGTVTGSVTLPGSVTRSIIKLVVHPTDPNIVYVTFSGS